MMQLQNLDLESKKNLRLVSSTLKTGIDKLDPVYGDVKVNSMAHSTDNLEIKMPGNKIKKSPEDFEDLVKEDMDSDQDTSMDNDKNRGKSYSLVNLCFIIL